ncbi:MAG: hypothetical protein HYS18_14485 [Burkholderiales bacterium]|nr:hypothetical protein [Burkholderiales bacterium]
MIVPQFWAESRLQHRAKGKQITLRRFGWSDLSAADAQANADARVKEALERALSGEKLPAKEPKIPYNGAAGVPIREEIVSRHGDAVITRNSYGARCLNTPNVLFADIDFQDRAPLRFTFAVLGILILLALAVSWLIGSRGAGIALGALALLSFSIVSRVAFRAIQTATGGAERTARKRIDRFLAKHPGWNLRLYKTPAGLRVAATHKLFSPSDPDVSEFFKALGTDPIYVSMCMNQQCFRARVSAKPWRIGIESHLRPRPGVWPVAPEHLPIRTSWIDDYEKTASSYAACTFLETVGNGAVHLDVRPVLELHDELCAATSKRPIA